MNRLLFVVVLGLGMFPQSAAAQSDFGAPPLEVGLSVGVLSSGGGGADLALGGPRATVHMGRAAVEIGADVWGDRSQGYRSLRGTYYVLGKYWLRETDGGFRIYATFGGTGIFRRNYMVTFDERHKISDRKVWRLERPSGAVGGISMDRPLGAHLAFRASVEAFLRRGLLAAKLTTGISVAIGSYDG